MSSESFLNGRVTLHCGDSLDILRMLPEASIDACVTDPPYALVSIGKRFGKAGAAACVVPEGRSGAYARASAGFMGKTWDTGERAFAVEFWAEVYRVLKPGGHVLAFGGTRTYHRLACAVEDAGFEIRDQLGYIYGTGFPKSHNIYKSAAEKLCRCGTEAVREYDVRSVRDADVSSPERDAAERREVLHDGLSQQGAPADGLQCPAASEGRSELGLEGRRDAAQASGELRQRPVCEVPAASAEHGADGRLRDGASVGHGRVDRSSAAARRVRASSRPHAAQQPEIKLRAVARQPKPQARGAWPDCPRCGKPIVPAGLGTALKPAWEPIVMGRKPLQGTVAENVLAFGTGAVNISGCRVPMGGGDSKPVIERSARAVSRENYRIGGGVVVGESTEGRWPANVILDGSEEVVAVFPEAPGQQFTVGPQHGVRDSVNCYGDYGARPLTAPRGDAGSAARFFYNAKADGDDRVGSKHPTVKPVDLMRYLVRLVTPPGGTVLDPFAGTGTTGAAAYYEGFSAVLCERETEYQADIRRRMALCLAGPDERRRAIVKAKAKPDDLSGTLFAPPPAIAAE